MTTKYGKFTDKQVKEFIVRIRKTIFLLLLLVDEKTKDEQRNIDVDQTFESVLTELGGCSSITFDPPEIVEVVNVLEAARIEYHNPNFEFKRYRKLILDAGAKMQKVEEVA